MWSIKSHTVYTPTHLFVCLVASKVRTPIRRSFAVSAVELKAVHDSFVELYMQLPYKSSLDFFQKVLTPACEKMASCSRGRGKLAGTKKLVAMLISIYVSSTWLLWALSSLHNKTVLG